MSIRCLSPSSIRKEHQLILQKLLEERTVDPSRIEHHNHIYELQMTICYFLRTWMQVLFFLVLGYISGFLLKFDSSLSLIIAFFYFLFGAFKLLGLQRELNRVKRQGSP
jgi:hypothetical protein